MGSHSIHTARWVLPSQNGIDSLRYEDSVSIPNLMDDEVLVEMHAASINYRDLVITKVSQIFHLKSGIKNSNKSIEHRNLSAFAISNPRLGWLRQSSPYRLLCLLLQNRRQSNNASGSIYRPSSVSYHGFHKHWYGSTS